MARAGALLAAALALALAQRCSAFYLPGVAPQDYEHVRARQRQRRATHTHTRHGVKG